MLAFGQHRRADRQAAASDQALLFLVHAGRQKPVQLFQVAHLRHGHQIVPPKLATFAFDAALFMAFAGRAELRLKSPVRAEGDEPRGLFALTAAQDLLHRGAQVIEPQGAERLRQTTRTPVRELPRNACCVACG